jgi:TRAP-type C4-dicarboxylate transport system substrate-binding protein
MFADYSMKFYEVQDYFTQIWAEPFLGIPTVNMQFFDMLPDSAQQKMKDYWANAIIPAGEWIDERNASDMEKIKEERPEVEFTYMTEEQIAPFRTAAKTVYPKFVELGGEDAQLVLETLLQDIAEAKEAVGVQ